VAAPFDAGAVVAPDDEVGDVVVEGAVVVGVDVEDEHAAIVSPVAITAAAPMIRLLMMLPSASDATGPFGSADDSW